MSKVEKRTAGQELDAFTDILNTHMSFLSFPLAENAEKPMPLICERDYHGAVLMIDEYGHIAEPEPTIKDMLEACKGKGFDPDKDRENQVAFGELVMNTLTFYGRLFEEGVADAAQDPELAFLFEDPRNVIEARYELVKTENGSRRSNDE